MSPYRLSSCHVYDSETIDREQTGENEEQANENDSHRSTCMPLILVLPVHIVYRDATWSIEMGYGTIVLERAAPPVSKFCVRGAKQNDTHCHVWRSSATSTESESNMVENV